MLITIKFSKIVRCFHLNLFLDPKTFTLLPYNNFFTKQNFQYYYYLYSIYFTKPNLINNLMWSKYFSRETATDCCKPSYLGNKVFLCLYVTSKLCLKVVKNSRQEEYQLYKLLYNYLHLCDCVYHIILRRKVFGLKLKISAMIGIGVVRVFFMKARVKAVSLLISRR